MKNVILITILLLLLCSAWVYSDTINGVANQGLVLASGSVTTALGFTPLNPANNLSEIGSASTSRSNLGLGSSATQSAILRGTTTAISGTITGVGACLSATTVTVTGARTTMVVLATPVTNPGVGALWSGWVSSNDTVSVQLCSALATLSLTSSAYNVAVIQ
jgi:hypothetical protein